tara:strand:+ start:270 stop:1061 length:792 start_codon:yes stop_codon:yes gene_type:complete
MACLIGGLSAYAQKDTTKVKEEIIIASELFTKTDYERRQMILKPKFRYINQTDKNSLLKVGFRPAFGPIIHHFFITDFKFDFVLSYEKRIKKSPFSVNLETVTRFNKFEIWEYDYVYHPQYRTHGVYEDQRFEDGKFYNHRFSLNLTFRYYYNYQSRIEAEVTGDNLYSEYFLIKVRDVLTYTEIDELSFRGNGTLKKHVASKQWLTQPSYLTVGWGIQRPFLKKTLIDANMEIGTRVHGIFSQKYNSNDVLFNLNFFIGLGL